MRFPAPRAAAARTAAAAKADWPVAFASDPDVRHSDSALPWMYSLRVRRRSRRRSPGSTLLIFASLVEFTLHFFPELTERFPLLAQFILGQLERGESLRALRLRGYVAIVPSDQGPGVEGRSRLSLARCPWLEESRKCQNQFLNL